MRGVWETRTMNDGVGGGGQEEGRAQRLAVAMEQPCKGTAHLAGAAPGAPWQAAEGKHLGAWLWLGLFRGIERGGIGGGKEKVLRDAGARLFARWLKAGCRLDKRMGCQAAARTSCGKCRRRAKKRS
eukprot:GGOE01029294.1.p2 GENE.GGOE01029294.1~~GGOE01029294.1.p2  ORF type:complete len:127 (+),score=4.49 GGOE01029294.1:586-966(+)